MVDVDGDASTALSSEDEEKSTLLVLPDILDLSMIVCCVKIDVEVEVATFRYALEGTNAVPLAVTPALERIVIRVVAMSIT